MSGWSYLSDSAEEQNKKHLKNGKRRRTFAFPTQTLHMAGDEKRPLTVSQRWVSEEEAFSPSSVLAQAAAPGAQAVQTTQTSASETVRPQVSEVEDSKPKTEGKLTDAPLEDDVLHGDSEGEADDDGDAQR